MFLITMCMRAGLVLSFLQPAHQLCTQGTPKQCQEAEFVPGTSLAGDGFDITTMELKGAYVLDMTEWKRKDKTCTLCSNPYMEKKWQKLPLSVVNWRPKHFCSASVSSKLHRSSESLLSASTSSVENNWKLGLDVDTGKYGGSLMLAGTNSKLAKYSMGKTKNDKFSFVQQNMFCEYYSYGVTNSPRLHREFKKAVSKLPKTYSPTSKHLFYSLIDTFGTHYITKVKLGGAVKSVTSVNQCQTALQGLSAEEVQMCLQAEASTSVAKTSSKTELKHCRQDTENMGINSSFSGLFRDRFTEILGGHTTEPDLLFSADKNPSAYKEWLSTLPQNPDTVSYSLASLHELLPEKTHVRKNLLSAISHYILERGLWRNCSDGCQAGIRSDSRDPCVCQCHNDPAVNRDCCPTQKGMARVIITVQRASNLYGDTIAGTDAYVKVFLNNVMIARSNLIWNNNNPYWDMVVDLGSQRLSTGHNVRFEVWDEDNKWDDDKLGECTRALSAGVKEDLCALDHGQFFFKLEVECAPSLGGRFCSEYIPSPMSQSLRKLYVSRHAHPVPKPILLKMGVFVEDSSSQRNLTAQPRGQRLMRLN